MSNLPSKGGENDEKNDNTGEKKQQSEIPTKDQASLKGQQFGCENFLINPTRAFYCCSDMINLEKYDQALTFSNEFLQVIFISDAFLSYRGRNQARIIEMQTQKQYRIQSNSIYSYTFDIKTTGVELLRLLPQENKKQQLNHESGTFLIFYYFRSGLQNIDKLQSSNLKNHLKKYLFMLDYNYKIFGSKDFQLEEDFEKFQLLYLYLISFDVPEELILDSLDIVAACIILSEQNETVKFDKNFLTPCDDQFNSITQSTKEFDEPSDPFSLGQILKLQKEISLQQLQEIRDSCSPSTYFIGKDNVKASIYYNYEILWNFIKSTINNKVFQSINSQYSSFYINQVQSQVLYEPATYVFNQKEKIYDLNFPDFVSNFVNDFLDEQFRNNGFNSLNEKIYKSLFFQKFQSGQQLISSLQKLNDFDQKFSTSKWNQDWIMMKSDANQSIYYQLTGFQEQNCYQLDQQVCNLYEQSNNQLLQKFRPNQSITLLIHIQKQIADILNLLRFQ